MVEKRQDRIAIVTGAARGLGAAIALRLAADGMSVAALDLDARSAQTIAAEIAQAGVRGIAVEADVSDPGQVETAVARVVKELGPPTVLVNNAGVTRDNLIFKMTDDDWDLVVDVHLKGTFLMIRAAQEHMVKARWGRIVNISSTGALGNRGQINYSAAKSGILGLTKAAAKELGEFGVTANAVAPGFIDTHMTRATAERLGVPWEEFTERTARDIPVRRVGRPDDIANAVSFFVADEADFVSGQVLYVAGGPRT